MGHVFIDDEHSAAPMGPEVKSSREKFLTANTDVGHSQRSTSHCAMAAANTFIQTALLPFGLTVIILFFIYKKRTNNLLPVSFQGHHSTPVSSNMAACTLVRRVTSTFPQLWGWRPLG